MTFFVFNVENDYTTDEGKPCSLEGHLRYLEKWGGSPDFFDSAETLEEAIFIADDEYGDFVVVEDLEWTKELYSTIES